MDLSRFYGECHKMQRCTIVFIAMLIGLQGTKALAQEDPDFGIEIQNNTACGFITGNAVNIRSEPSTSASVVTVLYRGDRVRVSTRNGRWFQLAARTHGYPPQENFEPLQGWVFHQYIDGCILGEFYRWRK